ncbi:hypothetical protein N7448_006912 [Penicillium atrosanguineum]|nr:hypothetical protein N7448_006912 [Penicillium atrosanguineum]
MSKQGSRLRPPPLAADSLANVGFVSKGDKKLLDYPAQKEYFDKITKRYLQFCADHKEDLDAALASLPISSSNDATSNPPAAAPSSKSSPAVKGVPPPSAELSTILLSLRKLREAALATSSSTPVDFSQKVHYFSIRLSILAQHPPSYFPSLRYSLDKLHSTSHPFEDSEVKELVTYMILRLCMPTRRHSQTVDQVLTALMNDNWIVFWRVRKGVDSYVRAVMNWAVDRVRRHALKAVGSAYLNVHVSWVVGGCTGDDGDWTWDKLVETEKLGWQKEGDKVIIRRPKPRPPPQAGSSAPVA